MKTASVLRAVIYRQTNGRHLRVALALSALAVGMLVHPPAKAGLFVPTGSLREARANHTATVLANGKVLVAGGAGTNFTPGAELYDPATGVWTPTGAQITPRRYHTATLLPSGKVLVAGGEVGGRSFAGAELYDPATGTWTLTGSLNVARDGHTATLLPNGRVLVAGGERYDGTNPLITVGSAELFDPGTGTWTVSGSLHEPREYHTATLLPDGKVLVAGGFNYGTPGPQLDSAELYDPATGTWSLTGPLTDRRSSHTATLLANGKVLVAGGGEWGSFGIVIPLDSAELYDQATGTWTLTGASNAKRWAPTATLLANGHVLLAGGQDGFFPFASAEEYDSISGDWSSIGDMTTNRFRHTATSLINGKVLLAGGYFSGAISSAELYESSVGPVPAPVTITNANILTNGAFQFSFTNIPGEVFSVLATTFPTLPSSEWMVLGGVTEIAPGQFRFTDTQATNYAKRFYRTRSP